MRDAEQCACRKGMADSPARREIVDTVPCSPLYVLNVDKIYLRPVREDYRTVRIVR